MDEKVLKLMRTSSEIGEVCTGAYGYLSAAVDSFLHSEDVTQAQLYAEFGELQREVTAALQRIIESSGFNLSDVMNGIAEEAERKGYSRDEAREIVRSGMHMIWPYTGVTKP